MSFSPILPTEDSHFKAYYPVWIGSLSLLIGIALCALTIGSMIQSSSFNSFIIIGIASVIAGYFYLTQPYFTLAPNRLTIYNPFGKVVKRYPFKTFSHLKIERDTLYVEGSFLERDRYEPTNIKRLLVKPKDWEKIKAITEQHH